ncbi:MAG: hypothetical protein ABI689_07825 [Thermoanaerobaculia bacterium]
MTKFREVEEARQALQNGPRAGFATFFALRRFALRVRAAEVGPGQKPGSRGVRRFRSLEDAQRDRLLSAT